MLYRLQPVESAVGSELARGFDGREGGLRVGDDSTALVGSGTPFGHRSQRQRSQRRSNPVGRLCSGVTHAEAGAGITYERSHESSSKARHTYRDTNASVCGSVSGQGIR